MSPNHNNNKNKGATGSEDKGFFPDVEVTITMKRVNLFREVMFGMKQMEVMIKIIHHLLQ